jgi:hypothetical protein
MCRLAGQQDGAPVRCGARHQFRADAAVGAGPVVDDDADSGLAGQLLGEQPREHVVRPARRVGHDEPQLLAGNQRFKRGLRSRSARKGARAEREHDRSAASEVTYHGFPFARKIGAAWQQRGNTATPAP